MPPTGRSPEPDEDGFPAAPPIPSFDSLRAPRRSSPGVDVLLPPAAQAELPYPADDDAVPAPTAPATRPAPRPAEWTDLLRFGLRAAQAALCLPAALVREPARRLRRLLGE